MVKCIKLHKEDAQKAINFLASKKWLNKGYVLGKTQRYVLIALTDDAKPQEALKKFGASLEQRNLQKLPEKTGNIKHILKGVVPDKYFERLKNSFDMIGDIAVLEILPGMESFEHSIAWNLMRKNPNIKVIAKKASNVKGKFRTREIKVILGEKRTTTIHTESGIRMKVDVSKTYFSPRSGNERLRISSLVKENEKVLVMFAGVGPFALLIAKQHPKAEVIGVELNPLAVEYFNENIRANRLPNVKAILGDVKEFVKNTNEKYDRVIMPLPENSWAFLDDAFKVSKKGTVIHFYTFCEEKKIKDIEKQINEIAKKENLKVKIQKVIQAGSHSPYVFRYCFDIQVQ